MQVSEAEIVMTGRWGWVIIGVGWLFVLTGLLGLLFALFEIAILFTPGSPQIPGVVVAPLPGVAMGSGYGIGVLLFGIWLVGSTTKITFSGPPGHITVTRGLIPVFLPSSRWKKISTEEARTTRIEPVRVADETWYGKSVYRTVSKLNVRMHSGKTLTICSAFQKTRELEYVEERIKGFARQ